MAEEIAIVGAGIGGLALALGLARAGQRLRVYEQAPELREIGAGVSLSPNAVKGLRYLGIGERLEALADEPPTQVTRHYANGKVLVNFRRHNTREQLGAPYLQAHRADLHDLLRERLATLQPDALVLDRELTAVSVDSASAYVLGFADGSQAAADLLVGADGLKSTVRREVFSEPAPEFSGFVAWRGLVTRDELGAEQSRPGSMVFVAPGRMFVRYPVRHGALQNFVAFSRADNWTAEGWSQTGDIGSVRGVFSDFHEDARVVLGAFSGTRCHKWGLFSRPPLPRWVKGRATVLGDAAHPMLPWLGQGAAMAIEDAVILCRSLIEFKGADEALRRYENARLERVTVIHRESLHGGERLMQQDPDELARRPVVTEETLGLSHYDPATEPL
ncbi:MAG: NAD(P)-binding protein [Gammaproteobacteria bacterium]|nr:NAD(P)-binding protein [Gammaproteobacteria bacterium]MYF59230.1 NAD(P)-binding protein [Gammaproteobacteria bacterium]MYH32477.1 NAD(P)-binding protein [Gammaproteobacteria bacterium]MYH34535.1 NAD(P)-binding protein [Gammaproteobacteria bacterium]MYL00718.1 NAD(P)-binding protein [Gammaproteobacteria bacterium]